MDIMVMHGALSAGNKLYRTGSIVSVDDALGEELIMHSPDQFCQAVGKVEPAQETQPEAEPAKDTKAKDEPKAEKEVGLPSADPSAAIRK